MLQILRLAVNGRSIDCLRMRGVLFLQVEFGR
ncbi:hypothetical protein K239x_46240 [Planctomycetes bacterium K23_9]|uniref:Uncharacterized protein n=1 Tax=Stieleria marina TaxID=1930275 RepID=A0A517NZR3_9BACT|nr:hypothetical protein K239x_46240 [Planctomycetes bacterium K23_9]